MSVNKLFHWDKHVFEGETVEIITPLPAGFTANGQKVLTTTDSGTQLVESLAVAIPAGTLVAGAPVALPLGALSPASVDGITVASNAVSCPNAGFYRFILTLKITNTAGCNLGVLLKQNGNNYRSAQSTVQHLASNDVKPSVTFEFYKSAGADLFTFFVGGDSSPTTGTPPTWDTLSSLQIMHIRKFPA